MKILRSVVATAGLSAVLSVTSLAADPEPGYVDIGQLMPSAKGQFVEVNISPAMLKFAARIAARQEPEAAEMIRNLKSIRVNVVGLDDTNRAATVEQIESVRRKLETQGWTMNFSMSASDMLKLATLASFPARMWAMAAGWASPAYVPRSWGGISGWSLVNPLTWTS